MVKVVGYLYRVMIFDHDATVVNVRKHLRYLLTTLTGPMGKVHRPVNRVANGNAYGSTAYGISLRDRWVVTVGADGCGGNVRLRLSPKAHYVSWVFFLKGCC